MIWHCTCYLFWVCSYINPKTNWKNIRKQSNKHTHTTVNWITFVSNTMASSRFFLVASLLMALMFSSMITSSRATKQLTKKQTLKPKFFGHPFPKPGFPQFPRPGFPKNPMPFPQFPKPGFPQLPAPGQGFPNNPMPFPQFPKPGFPQFPGFGFPKFPQFPKPGSPSFPPATPTISTPTLSNWNFSSKLIWFKYCNCCNHTLPHVWRIISST